MVKQKVVVIGAGVGGMASAIRLAKSGYDVSIYEASDRTGGKCRTEWFGDYGFDTGPSLLTLPAVYRDLFLKTGKRLEHILKIQPVDPAFAYHFADGTQIDFPNLSIPAICAAIDEKFGQAAGNQWHNLMQRAQPMHKDSSIRATSGTISPIPDKSNSMDNLFARRSASALPPGGQSVGGASPATKASAAGRQPG